VVIKLTLGSVYGFGPSMNGMRNPKNSWAKNDTFRCEATDESDCNDCIMQKERRACDADAEGMVIGPNDLKLASKLAAAGPDHAKFRRMIVVYTDIIAPLYWWKEFDTYKIGTVANSCSTMHTIADKPFELNDFSHEHLITEDQNENAMLRAELDPKELGYYDDEMIGPVYPYDILVYTIALLNKCRTSYRLTEDPEKKKQYWWQMIQLLPSSYNQKRTVMLNYEVLARIYNARRNHKLDEWQTFCKWIELLPYAEELIICKEDRHDD
jgi:hypothetical protein